MLWSCSSTRSTFIGISVLTSIFIFVFTMGKVLTTLARPIKNFNLESRAHKVISKEKPTPAPKYKIDAEQYEQILKGMCCFIFICDAITD